jgi:hypothetical protein
MARIFTKEQPRMACSCSKSRRVREPRPPVVLMTNQNALSWQIHAPSEVRRTVRTGENRLARAPSCSCARDHWHRGFGVVPVAKTEAGVAFAASPRKGVTDGLSTKSRRLSSMSKGFHEAIREAPGRLFFLAGGVRQRVRGRAVVDEQLRRGNADSPPPMTDRCGRRANDNARVRPARRRCNRGNRACCRPGSSWKASRADACAPGAGARSGCSS